MAQHPGFLQRHRAGVLASIVAVMCVALLVAVEAFLGWRNQEPGQDTYRAIRLREHLPGLVQTIPMPDSLLRDPDSLPQRPVHLQVDADGFIGPARVHAAPELTVVFLGGSTTECLWVQEENRYPYLVGRQLEKSGAFKAVNSINGGRSANHTMHAVAALLGKVVPLAPDVCVLMENCNDLMVLIQKQTYWDTEIQYRNMIEWKRRPHESHYTRIRDLVRDTLPNVWKLFTPGSERDDLAALRGRKTNVDPVFIETNFRRSLLTFIRICRTWDITPVLMTQASRITEQPDPTFLRLLGRLANDFGVDYAEYYRRYHWMNELVRQVGRENEVLVIDLAAAIPPDKRYIYDPYHLNDAGSQLAASVITDSLKSIRPRSRRS